MSIDPISITPLSLSVSAPSPWLYALMVCLIIGSSFFSMSETAFSTANKVRLKSYIDSGKNGARKALWISENFNKTLSTILVGNNIMNIALTTISVRVFSYIFQNNQALIEVFNTVVMTIIILIFGEIVPKSVAKIKPEALAIKISGLMYFLIKFFTPITFFFDGLNKILLRNVDEEDKATVTEDELESIIDTMELEGEIEKDEATMLQRVLDLSEVDVHEIMTPRVDVVAISVDDDIEEIKDIFFKNQFSRVPVYEDSIDNIIGILYEREFFTKILKNQRVYLKKLIKKPLFVPPTMKADNLIKLFRQENNHMAIVTDEFGGFDGIVTMEDALEELVGEIFDEHDEIELNISKISDNKYLVNADYELDNFFEELDLGKRPETNVSSVGGWIIDTLERIPEKGDTFSSTVTYKYIYNELSEVIATKKKELFFEITDITDRRIKYFTVIINEVVEEDE